MKIRIFDFVAPPESKKSMQGRVKLVLKLGGGGRGEYSYIHVLPNSFLLKGSGDGPVVGGPVGGGQHLFSGGLLNYSSKTGLTHGRSLPF